MFRYLLVAGTIFCLIVTKSTLVCGFPVNIKLGNELPTKARSVWIDQPEQDPHVQAVHGRFDDLADSLLVLEPEVGEAALKHLEELAQAHRENRLKINTWKGVAESSYWKRIRPADLQHVRYLFAIDQTQEAHKVTSQTLLLREGHAPEVVFLLFVMRLGGDVYTMGPWSPQDRINTDMVISHGKLRTSHDSGHFSPLYYFSEHNTSVEDLFDVRSKLLQAGHSKVEVRRNDLYARIDTRSIKNPDENDYYVLDLKRGTTICRRFVNTAVETVWRQISHEEIDGVWLPKRDHQCFLYKQDSNRDNDRSHVVQFTSELNQALAENAFQLDGLGLGDEFNVRDRRTESRYRYRKDGESKTPAELDESENGAKQGAGSGSTPMTTNSFRPAMANPPNLVETSWSYRELIVIVGMGIATFSVFHCIGTILNGKRIRRIAFKECESTDG